ncbi:MAG: prepilin-type N-terminal cleavage/methylation domain-containing protein [Candidatus Sumerlaeia bacterium]|nr:prepilin-type N-terminal cleavage/methylation domain-containing protein [Candidatus Sumerlaeia bacterium]
MKEPSPRHGFTLIELLIVVAIIAILAAIAVPNFLQAQTRSKVSRALSDLRTMRTAVEAYAVDWNRYPRFTWPCAHFNDRWDGFQVAGTLPTSITSPIGYLSTIPLDPFAQGTEFTKGDKYYAYAAEYWMEWMFADSRVQKPCVVEEAPTLVFLVGNRRVARQVRQYFGGYYLWCTGPAGTQVTAQGNVDTYFLQYDPTNGTISPGRIFVAQKFSEPTYVPPDNFF